LWKRREVSREEGEGERETERERQRQRERERETETERERQIDYKELAHMIVIISLECTICKLDTQENKVDDIGLIQSKSGGLRTRKTSDVNSSPSKGED
jgi:hypothetical protein